MANKASDQVHQLIRSMSKPEKRYFKLFSSRHHAGEENNYQILFDAIDRQAHYDEAKLLNKFRGKAFIHRFSITKNRLYNAILRSLDAYHSNSSLPAQLYRQIHTAEILFHKSLYDQCAKIIEGAKKLAKKHDLYPVLIEISQWEKRIHEKSQGDERNDVQALDSISTHVGEILSELHSANELWHVKGKIFHHLYRLGKVRDENETHTFLALLEEVRKISADRSRGTEMTYQLNHLQSACHFGLGEYEKCYPLLEKNLLLIEKNKSHFKSEPSVYLSVLTNAMYVGMRLGKWKESFRLMDKLRIFRDQPPSPDNEDNRIRLFTISHSAELALFTQAGEFELGIGMVPVIESALLRFEGKIPSVRLAHFYFNIAVCYFGTDRHHEALRWLNRLLNEVPIDHTRDIHCMAQLLSLIVHIELKNDRLLPYALRSATRFLSTRNKVFQLEETIFHFINESLKKRNEKDETARFTELAEELARLKQNEFECHAFEFFDFLAWARSKVCGKKYREMLAA
jgi:tetratricopeptide (TPR) repeat protein